MGLYNVGYIHGIPLHIPILPVRIEGLWEGSALIKHNRHLSSVDLRDSGGKSLKNPTQRVRGVGGCKGREMKGFEAGEDAPLKCTRSSCKHSSPKHAMDLDFSHPDSLNQFMFRCQVGKFCNIP